MASKKHLTKSLFYIFIFWLVTSSIFSQTDSVKNVVENASPEAIDLLNYIYSISGKGTLSGQHNEPLYQSINLSRVYRQTGHYPAVYGQDFGFADPGLLDGINYRQRIIDEAILRHRDGFIITLMWHAVPPTEEEPVKFRESIQSDLSDEEWEELITPGTYLNEKWKSQVDVIAWFLKQLKHAEVPVLWRPYHEMNGGWFWWGKKSGDNGYAKLWKMMFDRFTNFHGLNNLIWVYNTNEEKMGVNSHAEHFPGHEYVDIIATDVYSENFNTSNYESMLELAKGKPIAIGECGKYPGPDKLEEQPKWTWFMKWSSPTAMGIDYKNYLNTYKSDQVINHDDLPWVEGQEWKRHYPYLK
jgi:mannan endo-1,4-beta-mannosidase